MQLSDKDVAEIFFAYLKASPRSIFAMHTDMEAISGVCRAGYFCPQITHDDMDFSQRVIYVLSRMRQLTPREVSSFRAPLSFSQSHYDYFNVIQVELVWPTVSLPSSVGDHYLNMLLTTPVPGVRPELVQSALEAFFAVMWGRVGGPSDVVHEVWTHSNLSL